jgi:hypothetical protein
METETRKCRRSTKVIAALCGVLLLWVFLALTGAAIGLWSDYSTDFKWLAIRMPQWKAAFAVTVIHSVPLWLILAIAVPVALVLVDRRGNPRTSTRLNRLALAASVVLYGVAFLGHYWIEERMIHSGVSAALTFWLVGPTCSIQWLIHVAR